MKNEDYLKIGQDIKTKSIIAIVCFFTIILSIVTLIISIINAIKILTTTWSDADLEKDKTLWGILSLVLLGPIASLIFASKVVNTYENKVEVETPQVETPEVEDKKIEEKTQ